MIRTRFLPLLLTALLAGAVSPALAGGNKNAVKQDNKVAPQYLQMPRMAVAVPVEGTEASRQLELELWVYVPDQLLLAKLTTKRSTVADTIRQNLRKNTAETYLNAEEGPLAIKEIARDAVEAELGKDAVADVLIKSLLVR